MKKFGTGSKIRTTGNRLCRFCGAPNWTPLHKCPTLETNCREMRNKSTLRQVCRQKNTNNRTVKNLNEEETDDRDETSSELEESIHHIGEIKKIEQKKKHYPSTVKIIGKKKDFVFDTRSTVTIMPPDEKILELTGIEKIANRYQDVNKNEVKFRGKIPVDVEYENKKRKMDILITGRTDIAHLLELD